MSYLRSVLIPGVLFLLVGYASAGWVQQQSGTTANLRRVYFINPQTGWAAGTGNLVLRTTDGGAIWEQHSCELSIIPKLYFRDSLNGFVGSNNNLYRSSDGGISWQLISQSFPGISSLVFITPLKGWLVCAMAHSGDGGEGFLYQSTDGGLTWALRDSSWGFMYCDVAFADTLFGMVTTDNHAVVNLISTGYMKRTTNGGATWDTLNYGSCAYGFLRFRSPNYAWRSWHIYVPGGPYYSGVQKTTNRGVSWSYIWSGDPEALTIPDTLNGWVLNYLDTLFDTHDAGSSWSWQVFPGRYFKDVFFVDSLNGWLVGYDGLILHTTDGGSGVEVFPSHESRVTAYGVSPNPFTTFSSVLGHSSDRFSLYDISGRRVGVYKGDRIGEGLRAGVYFVRAEKGDRKPMRIVKIR